LLQKKYYFIPEWKKTVALVLGVIWSFQMAHWSLKDCLGVSESFPNFLHGKIIFLPLKSTKFRNVD